MENMETMEESNISSEELTGEKIQGYRGQNQTGSGQDCQYWNKQGQMGFKWVKVKGIGQIFGSNGKDKLVLYH